MARTVAVMASRAAKISTEERRTFDRFEASTRKEPSPGTFAFGSMYSETMSAFHPPPHACMLPMRIAGKAAGIRICFTYRPPLTLYALVASLMSFGTLLTAPTMLNRRYHCMPVKRRIIEATLREIGRAHVELQSQSNLVCRLLLEKKKIKNTRP